MISPGLRPRGPGSNSRRPVEKHRGEKMVKLFSMPGDFGRLGVLAAAILLASSGKASSEELRIFTVEDINDWEFHAFPPPPPQRVVSVEYDVASPEHVRAIP